MKFLNFFYSGPGFRKRSRVHNPVAQIHGKAGPESIYTDKGKERGPVQYKKSTRFKRYATVCQDRCQKTIITIRTVEKCQVEQLAKQPQRGDTARDFQKEAQRRKSQPITRRLNDRKHREQSSLEKKNATRITNLPVLRWKASWRTTRWQPTPPIDVSTIPVPGVLDTTLQVSRK